MLTLYDLSFIDQKLFLLIHQITNSNKLLTEFFQLISWLFSISNFTIYYTCYVIYFYIKVIRIADLRTRYRFFNIYFFYIIKSGFIYFILLCSIIFLKIILKSPRPLCFINKQQLLNIDNILIKDCYSSFPSGHSGLMFFIMYITWNNITLKRKVLYLITVILVLISRITLAMHYPSDLIFSMLISFLVINAANIFMRFLRPIIKLVNLWSLFNLK